jgi:hypothetical protein
MLLLKHLEHLQRCPCASSLNLPFEGLFGGEDFSPWRAGKMRAQSVPRRSIGRGRPGTLTCDRQSCISSSRLKFFPFLAREESWVATIVPPSCAARFSNFEEHLVTPPQLDPVAVEESMPPWLLGSALGNGSFEPHQKYLSSTATWIKQFKGHSRCLWRCS